MLKRFLLLVAATVVLSSCCSNSVVRTVDPFVLDRMLYSSVALVQEDDEGENRAYCSGVWLSDSTLLTAYHCTEGIGLSPEEEAIVGITDEMPSPLWHRIKFVNWSSFHTQSDMPEADEGVVIAADKIADLALVQTKSTTWHTSVSISRSDIWIGQVAHSVGSSIGLPFSYAPSIIGAIRLTTGPRDNLGLYLQTVSGATRGNSGGALFDDDGNVLGICSFIGRDTSLVFWIHRDSIRKFLKSSKVRL